MSDGDEEVSSSIDGKWTTISGWLVDWLGGWTESTAIRDCRGSPRPVFERAQCPVQHIHKSSGIALGIKPYFAYQLHTLILTRRTSS